ncbi:hypothetical protein D6D23_03202 [Aureobasidium pullulans]|uniref:Uncharacterized protein n=1 Tax=Aureobasidium pullulans TaxID=5580 RepID=A0A4S8WL09_AURPU|nr:hypothetical protein D6D23_03202 [Aureobasidium pullulans]THW60016.1 hypothetical protein D6D20_06094 [Aureobasidium pullulans]THZ71000.1 hypothetical protein D6C85_05570 [Aureobasidium pullulans]THZ91759.1 hypothetical protein D6C82_09799 [Aureobasidium pullulans]
MLFLALPILACVGVTAVGVTAGSFAALWQSAFGTGPCFNTLLSAGMGGAPAVTVASTSTSAIFGAMFYGIKTPIMPPPKELEWWETDVFKNVVGLAVLLSTILLIVLRLRRYLHRKN